MTDLSEITAKISEHEELRTILASLSGEPYLAVGTSRVRVPESLMAVLRTAAAALADGDTLALISEHAEVSPAEAARLLGVSRQYVDRLVNEELLAVRRLPNSSYRRIPVRAVLDYAAAKDRKREAITSIVDDAIAIGLEY